MEDPVFFEDLRAKIQKKENPIQSVGKTLLRKRFSENYRRSSKFSVGLHVALLVAGLIPTWFPSLLSPFADKAAILRAKESKSAIRVDLVGLPDLTLQQLAKVDPTSKIGKMKIEDESPATTLPSPDAMILPDKKAAAEKARAESQTKAREEADAKAKGRLEALRSQLRADQRRKELMDKLKGGSDDGEGRPALAGNIMSEGYSVTGNVATDTDVWNGKAKAHFRKYWNIPGWMAASKLRAKILVKLSPEGRVLKKEFIQRSGNREFDQYIEDAISAAEPFPAPPDTLKRNILEEGIEWGFPE